MKYVAPTEARKNWFRLLDEVLAGEVVVVPRGEGRIVLRREESLKEAPRSYRGLISGPSLDGAEHWGWEWSPSPDGLDGDVFFVDRDPSAEK